MIYFIQADDPVNHIKIGFTDGDPLERLRSLQTGSPVRLCLLTTMPGTQQDEAALHRRFSLAHVHGEWFRPTPALLQLILSPAAGLASVASIENFADLFELIKEVPSLAHRKALQSGLERLRSLLEDCAHRINFDGENHARNLHEAMLLRDFLASSPPF